MSYIYTQVNRLEQPHSYMYTPFQGEAFLQAFHDSRIESLKQLLAKRYRSVIDEGVDYESSCIISMLAPFDSASSSLIDSFWQDIDSIRQLQSNNNDNNAMEARADSLYEFSVDERVSTLDLLKALIAALILGRHELVTKGWLDMLVQRFEVTKKLYEAYPVGFRKGEGSTKVVKLYWLFALALSLYHADTCHLKYLSTLLKVSDLLCSLPETLQVNSVSSEIMFSVLLSEMLGIELLLKKQEISCN